MIRQKLDAKGRIARRGRASVGSCCGFTLLELLIVVAIIALLLAILMPALRMVRQQTQMTQCQSNLRQIALAWKTYLHDSKGHFPLGVNLDITYGGIQGAVRPFGDPSKRRPVLRPLNPHLKLEPVTYTDGEVFLCPNDRGSDTIRPSYYVSRGTSYRANPMMIGQTRLNCPSDDPCESVCEAASDRIPEVRGDRISADNTRVILAGDFDWYATWYYDSDVWMKWHIRKGYANLAFVDGHAAHVRILKGLWVTDRYSILPHKDLCQEAAARQVEVKTD
jgi:prepilin-type N-terminal cleavage/methylation domain-containing protein/prepilin-type processing-associated H-X9-DG protein